MALISCPRCGKNVSDSAKLCPHCGMEYEERGEKITQYTMLPFEQRKALKAEFARTDSVAKRVKRIRIMLIVVGLFFLAVALVSLVVYFFYLDNVFSQKEYDEVVEQIHWYIDNRMEDDANFKTLREKLNEMNEARRLIMTHSVRTYAPIIAISYVVGFSLLVGGGCYGLRKQKLICTKRFQIWLKKKRDLNFEPNFKDRDKKIVGKIKEEEV